jgi:UDP-N-acetylmuramate dehydrogenase
VNRSDLSALVREGGDRVEEHASLGSRTTYRVGGRARVLVTLKSVADLVELGPLMLASGLAVVCVGNGSNLLVADGEHDVLIVHLTGGLAELTWDAGVSDVVVNAGAGLDLPIAARRLAREGLVGFEWAVGVPGTFGGAAAMNAGGHGDDLASSLLDATVWRAGTIETWSKDRLALGYRTSALGDGDVVLSLRLALVRGDGELAEARIREVVRWRREHQPGGANGGSVFRNPPEDAAARLIEAAGCKGLRYASARVSEKHANFIQADENGSANDVYALIELVRARVRDASGVTLLAENRFLGFGAPR